MPAAWTTPRTWTAGELVTAAIGNSAWRDNLLYLKDSPTFDQNVTVTGTTLLTGVATFTAAPVFSSATASQAVFTNGSKALVSNAITGTGNVVMSASPTLTGTIAGAAMTLSSTLGVTGAISSATSVALTGTANNLGTITTGAWNAGAVTSSGDIGSNVSSGTPALYLSNLAGGGGLKVSLDYAVATGRARLRAIGQPGSGDVFSLRTSVSGTEQDTLTINYLGNTTLSGLLTVSGFGTHSFSAGGTGGNTLQVINTTSGTGNFSIINLGNDAGNDQAAIRLNSTTFTTSGINVAAALKIQNAGAGGMDIVASNGSGAIRFYSGGTTERGRFTLGGVLALGGTRTSAKVTIDASLSTLTAMDIQNTAATYGGAFIVFSNTSNQTAGYISHTSATVVAYNTTSDARLKRDLGFTHDLSGLRATQVHEFEWLTAEGGLGRGVFAQDAYRVMPSAVTVGTDEINAEGQLVRPWSVDYSKFVPDLIVGWQQHDTRLAAIEAKLLAAGV